MTQANDNASAMANDSRIESLTSGLALASLETDDQRQLLNTIDSLRQAGLDSELELPQIVVCGDQSSGKSSVLEAITEIPFPRDSSLCTRYATEVILRNAPIASIETKIIPWDGRPKEEQDKLRAYNANIKDFSELPDLINRAAQEMGLSDSDGTVLRAFSRDVLSLRVSGPDKPTLTVVDLPGLIHSSNKKQTDTDISLVTDLVKDYISKDRTIICTVITSKNDAANQIILERAKAVDPKNERTFGILTKPDTLEEGSKNQATFIGLVRNEDTFLGLGWHILKNRAHGEEGYSPAERNEAEATFLSKGAWRDLPTYQKGVHCLRTRLSELLFQQIKKHLPDVRNEISRKLKGVNHDLDKLGKGRSTPAEQREYWFNTVRDFRDIARMAVSGYYSSDFFIGADLKEEKIVNRRLRARLQNIHLNFGQQMRLRGRKYIEKGDNAVVAETLQLSSEASSSTDDDNDDERCEFYLTGGPNQSIMMCGIPKQEKVSPVQMTRWIKKVLIRSRGRELPGLFQSLLVGELLWEQTSRWGHFATAHITACQELCSDLVEEILQSLVPQDVHANIQTSRLESSIKARAESAEAELLLLVGDLKKYPLTVNHYFTTTIQKQKDDRRLASQEDSINRYAKQYAQEQSRGAAVTTLPTAGLIKHLQTNVELDMDKHSCQEAADALNAIYIVEMKRFVDNVNQQVIERHIVDGLEDILTAADPNGLAFITDENCADLVEEAANVTVQREHFLALKAKLERGQEVLRKSLKKGRKARA